MRARFVGLVCAGRNFSKTANPCRGSCLDGGIGDFCTKRLPPESMILGMPGRERAERAGASVRAASLRARDVGEPGVYANGTFRHGVPSIPAMTNVMDSAAAGNEIPFHTARQPAVA